MAESEGFRFRVTCADCGGGATNVTHEQVLDYAKCHYRITVEFYDWRAALADVELTS